MYPNPYRTRGLPRTLSPIQMCIRDSYYCVDVDIKGFFDNVNHGKLLKQLSLIHIFFDNYIPFSVRMKEAVREGQSIFSYDPKGKATEAYRRVTEEVLKDAI